MFGSSNDASVEHEDREQRYEYKVIDIGSDFFLNNGAEIDEEQLQEIAENGWQFVGDIQNAKGTQQIIFERPV